MAEYNMNEHMKLKYRRESQPASHGITKPRTGNSRGAAKQHFKDAKAVARDAKRAVPTMCVKGATGAWVMRYV